VLHLLWSSIYGIISVTIRSADIPQIKIREDLLNKHVCAIIQKN
jgi:hypothetical protein